MLQPPCSFVSDSHTHAHTPSWSISRTGEMNFRDCFTTEVPRSSSNPSCPPFFMRDEHRSGLVDSTSTPHNVMTLWWLVLSWNKQGEPQLTFPVTGVNIWLLKRSGEYDCCSQCMCWSQCNNLPRHVRVTIVWVYDCTATSGHWNWGLIIGETWWGLKNQWVFPLRENDCAENSLCLQHTQCIILLAGLTTVTTAIMHKRCHDGGYQPIMYTKVFPISLWEVFASKGPLAPEKKHNPHHIWEVPITAAAAGKQRQHFIDIVFRALCLQMQ